MNVVVVRLFVSVCDGSLWCFCSLSISGLVVGLYLQWIASQERIRVLY